VHITTKADAKAAMLMQPARSDDEAPPEKDWPGCWGAVGKGEEIDKVVVVMVSGAEFASVSTAAKVTVLSSLGNRLGNRLDGAKEVVVVMAGVRAVGLGLGARLVIHIANDKEHCPWPPVSISDHFRRTSQVISTISRHYPRVSLISKCYIDE
jgi:hypothetical protein